MSLPPPSLLEQASQKVKHKLLPLIGPFPSQLHSWAALGASIWEGSAACFTKTLQPPLTLAGTPKTPFSPCQPLFCSVLCPRQPDAGNAEAPRVWRLPSAQVRTKAGRVFAAVRRCGEYKLPYIQVSLPLNPELGEEIKFLSNQPVTTKA